MHLETRYQHCSLMSCSMGLFMSLKRCGRRRFRAHVACMLLGVRIRYGFELLRLGALLLVKSKEV